MRLRQAVHTAVTFALLFLLVTLAFVTVTGPSMISMASNVSENMVVVPRDYLTIQAAIAAVTDGSTILVEPGRYNECLTIDKALKLIGNGSDSTIIESVGQAHTITIARGVVGAVLKDFTIQGSGEAPWSGIYVRGLNNTIENTVVTGHYYGIQIYDSSNNVLRNNIMTQNTYNLRVWGLYLPHFLQDIDSSNLVNGKRVLYWVNQQDRSVPLDVGFVALVNSSRMVVKDLSFSNNLAGVLLAYTTNSLVANVTAINNEIGLFLVSSSNNTVVRGNFSGNGWDGIQTVSSSGNAISGNRISHNAQDGIRLSHSYPLLNSYSENNSINGNVLSENTDGLYLEKSNKNIVSGNVMKRNTRSALALDESYGNILSGNTLTDNEYGIWAIASRDKVYHNNFVNNTVQAGSPPFSPSSLNTWDDGYPSGGNYWNDYHGGDSYRGQYQNETGSDGVGDTSYSIDANNSDHYPLMGTFSDFNATSEYQVQTVSNSSVIGFQFNGTAVSFNVRSQNDTANFCRVCIPRSLLNQSYRIFINGTEASYDFLPSNTTFDYLYFTLNCSTGEVVIVPEFPMPIFLLLFMTSTPLVIMIRRRKQRSSETKSLKRRGGKISERISSGNWT